MDCSRKAHVRLVANVWQQVSMTHEWQNDQRQTIKVKCHSNQRQNIRVIKFLHAQCFVDKPSHFRGGRPRIICNIRNWLQYHCTALRTHSLVTFKSCVSRISNDRETHTHTHTTIWWPLPGQHFQVDLGKPVVWMSLRKASETDGVVICYRPDALPGAQPTASKHQSQSYDDVEDDCDHNNSNNNNNDNKNVNLKKIWYVYITDKFFFKSSLRQLCHSIFNSKSKCRTKIQHV